MSDTCQVPETVGTVDRGLRSPVPWEMIQQSSYRASLSDMYMSDHLCYGFKSNKEFRRVVESSDRLSDDLYSLVNTPRTRCSKFARKDLLKAGWLWCGKCHGHRLLIQRFVGTYWQTHYDDYKHITEPSLHESVAEKLWDHPDLAIKIEVAKLCDPSFVTSSRVEDMLREHPMLTSTFCLNNLKTPNIPKKLLCSIVTGSSPFPTEKCVSIQNDTALSAAALIRKTCDSKEEWEAIKFDEHMLRSDYTALTLPEIEIALRDSMEAITASTTSLETWLKLLRLTLIPTFNGMQDMSPRYPEHVLYKIRLDCATNLLYLVRAAQRVAQQKITNTVQLSVIETVWALLIIWLLRHAARSINNYRSINKYDILRNRTDSEPNVRLDNILKTVAVEGLSMLTFLTRNGRLSADVFTQWFVNWNNIDCDWVANLAFEAATVCDEDNVSDATRTLISQNLTDTYFMLWNHSILLLQRKNVRYTVSADSRYEHYCYRALNDAIFSIENAAVSVWLDDNIAAAIKKLLNIHRTTKEQASKDRVNKSIRRLLTLPSASLLTSETILATKNTKYRVWLIKEDNERTDENRLLTETQLDQLANTRAHSTNTSAHIMLQNLAASPRLSPQTVDKIVTCHHDDVLLTLLKTQSNISKATLTMLAFNKNRQIAVTAATRLKEEPQRM